MNLRLWIVLAAIQFTYFASGNAVQTHTTFVAPSTLNSNIMLDLINPDHFNITGTDLWLRVQRPYGQELPNAATLHCLSAVKVELSRMLSEQGDRPFERFYTKSENGVKVSIFTVYGLRFRISVARSAIIALNQLMGDPGGPGTKILKIIVIEEGHGIIGKIEVSRAGEDSWVALTTNGSTTTTNQAAPTRSGAEAVSDAATLANRVAANMINKAANLTSANITGPLTPDHYTVPGTAVYVVVFRPYGHELPHETTIKFLISAAFKLSNMRQAEGDTLLPMGWSYQENGVSITFNPKSFNRPHLTVMQAGIVGLIDLMDEESVVGTKEILFALGVEAQGDMGSGQIKWAGGNTNGANENLGSVATAVASLAPNRPLGLISLQTGLVGTS